MDLTTLETQAKIEIAKIENAAVAEYLTLKTGHYSPKVIAIVAGVAFVLGFITKAVL